MCMVYRPRPARIVTLNPASWLLFEACRDASVDEVLAAVARARLGRAPPLPLAEMLQGLQELVDLSLVTVCGAAACPANPEE